MKFYINRSVVRGPWGGGNLWVQAANEQIKALGHESLHAGDFRARPDVIFIAGLESDGTAISAEQAIMYKMYVATADNPVKLIARINENDARKGTSTVDENMLILSEHIDATVFVSDWLKDYYVSKGWKCPNNTVVYNGVDSKIFKPNDKLDNGKTNIVAHHWSNNPMKGFDIYEEIDRFVANNPEFTFTYIGRENNTFKNTNVVRPLFGTALGAELGKYDVYVSASRFDPGPNHILEALSCELPTYVHKDGGGAVEFAGRDHAFSDWDELQKILIDRKFQNNSAIQLLDWEKCIAQYVQFAESIP